MRARIFIASVLLLVPCASHGQPWTSPRWNDYVTVQKLKEQLPTKEPETWRFLAELMDKPEIAIFDGRNELNGLTTGRWREWLPLFEKAVIAKAQKQSLDAESLQQCLVAVSNRLENLPHLPVAAYSTKQRDAPIWIIVFKWEFQTKKGRQSSPLGHTQVFALDSSKRTVVGFATCN